MFNKITVIGCGLIGSSILRVIEKKNIAKEINAYDKSKEVTSYLAKNFKFKICDNITEAVNNADLVIISSPLSSYKEILSQIQSNLKKGSILTDTGSAKKEINKIIKKSSLSDVTWIASHPIAGTEYSGPESGFAELFEKRWCILSADENTDKKEITKLEKFWIDLGSKIKVMSFEHHDYVLSLTSHLPHAVAYSIVKTAISDDNKFKDDVIQYSAGGLRDFTRIAASDPLMWKDIFIDNSENILKVLDNYSKNLEEIKSAIKDKDSKKLLEIFSSTKKVRKEIIEAGQDTEKPGFGRK
ncbi:prephenate dehydrogenase/arogenate dehydrogenase family protein [Pelagibacterales bacterium SAG-MED41]|nr:prephenate dehydrogenase/arogenate dehydrogenase family protein [Pelagibacterales bacterium SAG-MED41]